MAADQSLYQMDYSTRPDEWLDFDNCFEFPTGYLESNPPSLDSISPKDLELVYSDEHALNWDMDASQCPQPAFSDFLGFEDPLIGATDMPLDLADPNNNLFASPEVQLSGSAFDDTWSSFDALNTTENFYSPSSFRQIIESQAAADPRCFSKKEKRLEASIALHLQRLQDAAVADLSQPSDQCGSFPSPYWPDSVAGSSSQSQSRGSPSATFTSEPPSTSSTPPISRPSPVGGGVELVLDLNMNATTNLPKKQKPRSQAQKENYIKVRKQGACEKHRRQHKRCNCLDKAASRALNESAAAALIQPTKAKLEIRNTGQNFAIAARPMANNTLPIPHPTAAEKRRAVKSVPGSLQPSVALSPMATANVHHTERSTHNSTVLANTAHMNLQARQAQKAARPWRAVDHTPSVPGSSVTQSTQATPASPGRQTGAVRAVHFTAGLLHESPGLLRPFRYNSTAQQGTGRHVGSHTQTSKQARWKEETLHAHSGATGLSAGQTKFTQRFTLSEYAGTVVRGAFAQSSALLESAGSALLNAVLAFSAFWQSSSALTSWAGALLGRFVLSSSRQHRLFRKGMGLA